MPSAPLEPNPSSTDRPGSVAASVRIGLGAVFVATLMAMPHLAQPASVAASSCTGWRSQTTPPRTIRVLRTASGRVETVGFRGYVAEVMASGEWPSALRKATLEAGAVATKQYAWYYAMQGHHRPGYVRRGKCYDVRDDTTDQLYRPSRAKPTAKQEAAIRRTWGLTLRKKGIFFLTGYRAGTKGRCGADANGWKLYARSVEACARKGLTYQQILRRYLNPKLTFVWASKLGPLLRKPSLTLATGTDWERGVATVTWRPAHKDTQVARYRLQRKVSGGVWKKVPLASVKTQKARAWVKAGRKNRFRVSAVDTKGRRGPWAYSPRRLVGLRGPADVTLSATGPATELTKVRTRFDGRAIAFLAPTGPGMGKVKVLLNGRAIATVDLDRPASMDRAVVWARNFPRAKRRSITVKSMTPDERVESDGFIFLR